MDFTVTMVPAVYHIHQYVMVIDNAVMELMNITVVSFLTVFLLIAIKYV